MIIGIAGRIASGKDTLADMFVEMLPEFEKKAYADKVKEVASILTGFNVEKFNNRSFKGTSLGPEWAWFGEEDDPMTVREFLQELGTEAIREGLHENAWINALFLDYNLKSKWVISDVRFLNEAQAIKDKGGILIKLIRKNDTEHSNHVSEYAFNDFTEWDYTFENNGSLEDLKTFAQIVKTNLLKVWEK